MCVFLFSSIFLCVLHQKNKVQVVWNVLLWNIHTQNGFFFPVRLFFCADEASIALINETCLPFDFMLVSTFFLCVMFVRMRRQTFFKFQIKFIIILSPFINNSYKGLKEQKNNMSLTIAMLLSHVYRDKMFEVSIKGHKIILQVIFLFSYF